MYGANADLSKVGGYLAVPATWKILQTILFRIYRDIGRGTYNLGANA